MIAHRVSDSAVLFRQGKLHEKLHIYELSVHILVRRQDDILAKSKR